MAIDGVIKLAVNGKFVNGISKSTQKKGYLCLESEGKEIHFRNIKIMELLPGVPYAHNKPAVAFKANVKGYVPSPVDNQYFATVSIEK